MKTYLKLTSNYKHFSAVLNDDTLTLEWLASINLASVTHIGLHNIQISPLLTDSHNRFISVHTDLIKGNIFNPTHEIATIGVPKNSYSLPNHIDNGES